MTKRLLLSIVFSFTCFTCINAQQNRWQINPAGGITWPVGPSSDHHDHIEMSGKYISAVIRYGVNPDQSLYISRDIVWPMLRTIPNNTHASLTRTFNTDIVKQVNINKHPVFKETVDEISLDGKITIRSTVNEKFQLRRVLFPSTDKPIFCEKFVLYISHPYKKSN